MAAEQNQTISHDEQIGIHKGALSTLAKERQELRRILTIVEQLMQMHIEELKKQGIDLEKAAQDLVQKRKSASSAGAAGSGSLEDTADEE